MSEPTSELAGVPASSKSAQLLQASSEAEAATTSASPAGAGAPPGAAAEAEEGEPSSPGGSSFLGLFSDDDEGDDYEYLEQEDPDKRSVEIDFPGGRVLKMIAFLTRGQAIPWRWLIALTLYSAAIVTVSFFLGKIWSKEKLASCTSRWWCTQLAIDSNVASYVGFALFLLLGFRVNESYARYMDGIRIWNDDIAGVTAAFCTYASMGFRRGMFHVNDRERILGLAAAISVCIKRDLRGEKDLRELKQMLCPQDLAAIQKSPDMPGHCIYIINAYLMEAMHKSRANLPSPFIIMLMNHMQQLAGFQGQVMRIKNYKIAYGYAGHLRIFLIIWFALLPLALVESSGWLTILWVPFIAYGIIGMETMSKELADPFGYQFNDIRLGLMTEAIQRDVRHIYRKSISGTLRQPTNTPNMLDCPISQGGNLPDEIPAASPPPKKA